MLIDAFLPLRAFLLCKAAVMVLIKLKTKHHLQDIKKKKRQINQEVPNDKIPIEQMYVMIT